MLDTGRRALLVDNYEARMEAFGAELQKGDAPYQLRLMQEILERDPRALTDAVRQDNIGLAKSEAARKQLLGMAVDIALAGLPIGKWTSSAAEKLIGQAFTGQGVQVALKGLSGKLIDTATGQLTDEAKRQIVDALGKDNGNAEIAKNLANSLHDGIFNQINETDYDKEFMQNAYTGILGGIQLSRLPAT